MLEQQVKDCIDTIRPSIQSHGGDVEFVSMDGNTVNVRLVGACGTCPMALMTLHQGIEAQLREQISPELAIQRVE